MNFTFDGSDMQSGSRCHEECGEVRHGTGWHDVTTNRLQNRELRNIVNFWFYVMS